LRRTGHASRLTFICAKSITKHKSHAMKTRLFVLLLSRRIS